MLWISSRLTRFGFFPDLVLSVLVSVAARICIRDAAEYRRNKKEIKEFYNLAPIKRLIFRLYLPSNTYAPRHCILFQIVRFINLVTIIISAYFYIVNTDGSSDVCNMIACGKIILMDIPITIYGILVPKKPRSKAIDFSRFKKP